MSVVFGPKPNVSFELPTAGETFRFRRLRKYRKAIIVSTPIWVWAVTLAAVAILLAVDLFIIGRRPHEPSTKEAALWVTFYVSLAVLFGLGVWLFSGHKHAGEFFGGYITEYSMSVDNLFVFMLIMASFAVPRQFQQKALMVGIITALVLRGVFIAIGSALVERFVWIFLIFGVFLIYTAVQLLRTKDEDDEYHENVIIRWSRRIMPVSNDYSGGKILSKANGRTMVTPMLIVMIALGTTDLVFAVDSIPATFGLTKEGYLVFAVNVFALMGLRQLYFLLGGLLQKLVYLTYGLAAILGFIGVKLVLHALANNDVFFINGGQPIKAVPEINVWVSLAAIVSILLVATVASLIASRRMARRSNGSKQQSDKSTVDEPTDSDTNRDAGTSGRQDQDEKRSPGGSAGSIGHRTSSDPAVNHFY